MIRKTYNILEMKRHLFCTFVDMYLHRCEQIQYLLKNTVHCLIFLQVTVAPGNGDSLKLMSGRDVVILSRHSSRTW
jgi:hypothetical protein